MRKFPILLILLSFVTSIGVCQSTDQQAIIFEVKGQIEAMLSDQGGLKTFCVDNRIKGIFEVDITIAGKGEVVTVFMVSASVDDIRSKNLLKDKLSLLKFEDIKIPKKERIKFRQTINL